MKRKGEATIASIRRSHPFAVIVPNEVFNCGISLERVFNMAPLKGTYGGYEFFICYFLDRSDAERFRSAAHGWWYDPKQPEPRPINVWPPRNPRARAG